MNELLKYPLVVIAFDDHCIISGYSRNKMTPEPCVAVGFLIEETTAHYVICNWVSRKALSSDSEYAVIRKHKGVKIFRSPKTGLNSLKTKLGLK